MDQEADLTDVFVAKFIIEMELIVGNKRPICFTSLLLSLHSSMIISSAELQLTGRNVRITC